MVRTGTLTIPAETAVSPIINAPTRLMKQLGYADGYKYAHDYPGHFVRQQFLPDELQGTPIWHPQDNPAEQKHRERMQRLWGEDRFKGE